MSKRVPKCEKMIFFFQTIMLIIILLCVTLCVYGRTLDATVKTVMVWFCMQGEQRAVKCIRSSM